MNPYLNDEPTLDDRLGWGPYATALADLCCRCEPPFCAGVYGGWGSGKTSLLRQIERRLIGCEPAVATVWFNPWRHQFEDSPVVALLQEISVGLAGGRGSAAEGLKLLGLLGRASGELLLKALTGGAVKLADLVRAGDEWEAEYFAVRSVTRRLREAFAADIAELLARRGAERLVVLVDDLDRCRPELALRVLESLKLFLDADRTVYLLGIDPARLAAALDQAAEPTVALRYLDKVVQLAFWIPPPEPARLAGWLAELLPESGDELRRLVALAVGENPRALKRFVNGVRLWSPLVAARLGERYDPGLHLRLRLLQSHAPARYEALRVAPALWQEVNQALAGRELGSFPSRRAAELRRWLDDPALVRLVAAPTGEVSATDLAAYLPWLAGTSGSAEPATARWKPALLDLADGTQRALLVRDSLANSVIPDDLPLNRLPSLADLDLRGADLREADLFRADLRRTDLRDADLRGAMLAEADLSGAILLGARWDEAELSEVSWPEGYLPIPEG